MTGEAICQVLYSCKNAMIQNSSRMLIQNGFRMDLYFTPFPCFYAHKVLYCNNQMIEEYKYLSLIILYFIISECIRILMIHLSILPSMCRAMISILN